MKSQDEKIQELKEKISLYNQKLDELCKTNEVKEYLNIKKNIIVREYLNTISFLEFERTNLDLLLSEDNNIIKRKRKI